MLHLFLRNHASSFAASASSVAVSDRDGSGSSPPLPTWGRILSDENRMTERVQSIDDVLAHPFTALRFRRDAVPELMATRGVSRREARHILDDASDKEIAHSLQSACKEAGVSLPPELAEFISAVSEGFAKIGDGSFIKAIIAFFKAHPELVAAALKLLLMVIGI